MGLIWQPRILSVPVERLLIRKRSPSPAFTPFCVNPQSSTTGSLTLTLNDVSADVIATIVPGGPPVSVTTTDIGQSVQVTFDGTAAQRISLKISGVAMTGGNGYVDVSIKNPDGTILVSMVLLTRVADLLMPESCR